MNKLRVTYLNGEAVEIQSDQTLEVIAKKMDEKKGGLWLLSHVNTQFVRHQNRILINLKNVLDITEIKQ